MTPTYEINGSFFINKGMTMGGLHTLTNLGEIDPTNKQRYKSLDEAKQIKECDLDRFSAITIYEWQDNEITNVFFIK